MASAMRSDSDTVSLMACPSSRSNCFMRSSSCKGITSCESPSYTNLKRSPARNKTLVRTGNPSSYLPYRSGVTPPAANPEAIARNLY